MKGGAHTELAKTTKGLITNSLNGKEDLRFELFDWLKEKVLPYTSNLEVEKQQMEDARRTTPQDVNAWPPDIRAAGGSVNQ